MTTIRARTAASVQLVLILIMNGTGCSDNKPLTVKGSLSYKGQPVPAAIVKFYGADGATSVAFVRDGAFIATDLPAGEYKVSVESDDSGKKEGGKAVRIPSKYADPNTSGLVFAVSRRNKEPSINLD